MEWLVVAGVLLALFGLKALAAFSSIPHRGVLRVKIAVEYVLMAFLVLLFLWLVANGVLRWLSSPT